MTPDDLEAYREVRLRALQDSPSAFGSTYSAELARPQREWAERVQQASAGGSRTTFLAFDGRECVGLVGCVEDDLGADYQLVSMWVAPASRGTTVAADLLDAALAWAKEEGARQVGLWVTRGNDRAIRFYERAGFSVTGDVQPLPSDPSKEELRMLLQSVRGVR